MKRRTLNKKVILFVALIIATCHLLTGCRQESTGKDTAFGDYAFKTLQEFTNEYPRRIACTDTEYAAGDYIIDKLTEIGFTSDQIEREDFILYEGSEQSSSNIIATIPGQSEKIIVIGAHYDCVRTRGVDDNGSGVALLLESASRMVSEKPYDTIQYVFFGAEEFGCLGSIHHVMNRSQSEIEYIEFMINVDSIAAGDICYIYGGYVEEDGSVTNTDVFERVCDMAKELDLAIEKNPGLNNNYPTPATIPGCSDYYSFALNGIPYVYFEATNWEIGDLDGYEQTDKLGEVMHSHKDNLEVIEQNFPGRIEDHLSLYSELLDYILRNW